MQCICPECKNTIDLGRYTDLKTNHVIECNHCGITLQVTAMADSVVSTMIVDEGK